jgi:hypothetical protein
MSESLLEIVGLIFLIVLAAWFGLSFESAEFISAMIVGCAVLAVVVRSAYRDACRRQRWPGKKEKNNSFRAYPRTPAVRNATIAN